MNNNMKKIEVATKPCPRCRKIGTVLLTQEQILDITKNDAPLTKYLSAGDAERFISGFCPECWDVIFKNEEE